MSEFARRSLAAGVVFGIFVAGVAWQAHLDRAPVPWVPLAFVWLTWLLIVAGVAADMTKVYHPELCKNPDAWRGLGLTEAGRSGSGTCAS